jgi:membrane-associated phospholipid phosphatase
LLSNSKEEKNMDGWLLWGTRIIQSLQAFGNPVLDTLFKGITFVGDEKFALLVVPFLYWALDKALALRMGFLYLGSAYVNTVLKAVFAVPRPSATAVRVIAPAEGYSFPSGHAQTTTTVWGYLATQVRKAWFWAVTTVLIVLVGLSRVYLGVHYPQDVIVGTVIGLVLVAVYNWLLGSYAGRIRSRTSRHSAKNAERSSGERGTEYRLSLPAKLALAFAVPLLLLALHAEPDTGSSMGTLLGLGVGVTLEGEWVRFSSAGPWSKRIVRFLAGLIVLLGLYFGLKAVLPEGLLFRVVRYALIGLWASLGAPWMFLRLGLAHRE